jgi:hypothetical protein
VAAGGVVAQALYVLGGLALVRAPASVWRAFATLPRFLVRRMRILTAAGAGPSTWVRTPREADRPSERTSDEPIQAHRQAAAA